MPLTDAGATHYAKTTIGESVTPFDNTNARICVGDSSTAFAKSQTDLQASSNKVRKAMDATYPQRSGTTLEFRATFATGDANFTWREWGIANDASAGTLLNRKVQSLGTKTNVMTWLTVATIIVNNP